MNTFQCVLATNSDQRNLQSFAIYLYAHGSIRWTAADGQGGINGLGGNEAQVGINKGDGVKSSVVRGSGTHDIINIASRSNVGMPGVYVFDIGNGLAPMRKSDCLFLI